MTNKQIAKVALGHALGLGLYIVIIVSVIFNLLPTLPDDDELGMLAPILMLSLLVLSAAVTGSLVFLRPVMWYLDGRKNEAVRLLAYTLGIFFLLIIVLLVWIVASN